MNAMTETSQLQATPDLNDSTRQAQKNTLLDRTSLQHRLRCHGPPRRRFHPWPLDAPMAEFKAEPNNGHFERPVDMLGQDRRSTCPTTCIRSSSTS
jgi:hypothetical protein